jgi:PPM family protein phosphatase
MIQVTDSAFISGKGTRKDNEDAILIAEDKLSEIKLFAVCDGMGGHEGGKTASHLACRKIEEFINHTKIRQLSKTYATDLINYILDGFDSFTDYSDFDTMGTTIALVLIRPETMIFAHIGDSRIYHFRPKREKIIFQTVDHSFVNELVRHKIILPSEARQHPKKNIITKAIQANLNPRPEADTISITKVKDGDIVFLCSDGVIEAIDDRDLTRIVSGNVSLQEKILELEKICFANSKDNYSAILIAISNKISIRDMISIKFIH